MSKNITSYGIISGTIYAIDLDLNHMNFFVGWTSYHDPPIRLARKQYVACVAL